MAALESPAAGGDIARRRKVKPGDRVTVIAETDEYFGKSGEILEVNDKGDLVVDVEIPTRWRAVFKPHDVELEALVERR